ncbi:MAG: glycosyl hydrolase repeat-containing protein [Acidobacteria bacterium]|nr:glycosyl hydrolase repeat-containing protein [Acidobacteriota bacterium]
MLIRRFALLAFLAATTVAAQLDSALYSDLRWRTIGPFRGGRTVAAVGVRQQPNVFYIGVNNGGVWKSTDYGRIWTPIFDAQPTGSIGAIAVAPSDPNVLYVGSGEGLQRPDLSTGDGIYKSVDAGKTWQHLGLRDGQQIPAVIVDPKDPNRLFVAVLGHPYGPNGERGIYRSTDGGATFEKVLYRDENTGGMDVAFDSADPRIVYAVLWSARQGPWENAAFKGDTSGLFKSTDGGTTWNPLTNGLPRPADGLGRIGIDVAPSDPKRLYAVVGATKLGGVYRSDDAGASWRRMGDDARLWGRDGDFNEIRTDPKNPDVVYIANVVSWKSTDGGKTWAALRGAPGGDDYHRFWINPDDPRIILLSSDQGAVVSVNGGETWSSWYNQPSAQMFHVNTDNAFPYRVCGGQQESGSACVQSRGDDGQITFREWHPAGAEEYGYAVPDPLDPDLVFGGKLTRWDRRTQQVQSIEPKPLRGGDYRVVRTAPIVFSEADPHLLFFASNTLWKTLDRGDTWTQISPDLTRKEWAVPSTVGVFAKEPSARPKQRGVIYAIAPSPLDVNRIWAGTDDGLIHVTADGGKTWRDVTPPTLQPWWKVSILEASHFDAGTAYAAINTFRLDDLRPHIFRTRDGGATWSEIVAGIPAAGIVNVVREDPKRRGLLYAGTEREVYVSFDDGDRWQSLRLNMPASSIRDLVVHGDDVVVGTHGRGFWILDDVTPLRQLDASTAATPAVFFAPQQAIRWRWNKNTDTPLPADEPAGQNPPDGAILNYYLGASAKLVTIEIVDGAGNLVRGYASTDPAAPPRTTGQVPWYWIRPAQVPSASAGMHRFVWDLHYPPAPAKTPDFPIAAVPRDTAPVQHSPWALPGDYTVRLNVDGRTSTRKLTVTMDPRVTTPREGLQQQFALSKQVYDALIDVRTWLARIAEEKKAVQPKGSTPGPAGEPAGIDALAGEDDEDTADPNTLNGLSGSLANALQLLQDADVAPTAAAVTAVNERLKTYGEVMKKVRAAMTR